MVGTWHLVKHGAVAIDGLAVIHPVALRLPLPLPAARAEHALRNRQSILARQPDDGDRTLLHACSTRQPSVRSTP